MEGLLCRQMTGLGDEFLAGNQELEISQGYENIEGATKAGRQELIYTSYKGSKVSNDLPVVDESRQRHRPTRNMAGANRISGYNGGMRIS